MALATHALSPIPPVAGVALTCHVAVWYWAAQEAQAQGLSTARASRRTLVNIAGMAGGPQVAMLGLRRSGTWDFNLVPATPPKGTVLLWTGGATHSAVVVGSNQIRGYNQVAQFPAVHNVRLTTATPAELGVGQNQVSTIAENTIVTVAGALNL